MICRASATRLRPCRAMVRGDMFSTSCSMSTAFSSTLTPSKTLTPPSCINCGRMKLAGAEPKPCSAMFPHTAATLCSPHSSHSTHTPRFEIFILFCPLVRDCSKGHVANGSPQRRARGLSSRPPKTLTWQGQDKVERGRSRTGEIPAVPLLPGGLRVCQGQCRPSAARARPAGSGPRSPGRPAGSAPGARGRTAGLRTPARLA